LELSLNTDLGTLWFKQLNQSRFVAMIKTLFHSLPIQAWSSLEHRSYGPGDVICHEGELSNEMFIISSGKVLVCKAIESQIETVLARFGPGECFGEFSLFDNAPRSATVQAEEATELLVFNRSDLEVVIQKDPTLAANFLLVMLDEIAQRVRSTNEQLNEAIRWGLQARGYSADPEVIDNSHN
jgi:CRP/FNR family transcriptional regulator, cyclic AMP receptor protein